MKKFLRFVTYVVLYRPGRMSRSLNGQSGGSLHRFHCFVFAIFFSLFFLLELMGTTHAAPGQMSVEGQFVFPVLLGIEPIKRLLVVSFKGDPEYEMIEPQYFDDAVLGKGLRILVYRKDKKVDVYYQPGIVFDAATFSVGGGTGYVAETPMLRSRFETDDKGVHLDISFVDCNGRQIELYIQENKNMNKPFPFLAPVGNDIENPTRLFLPYMQEFDFVVKEGTEFRAIVGERMLHPASFPVKRNGEKVWFARYASKVTIGEINSSVSFPLVFRPVAGTVRVGAHTLILSREKRVVNCRVGDGDNAVELQFDQGFPNLLSLQENEKVKGSWSCRISGISLTGGEYTLQREKERVNMELNVLQKWHPQGLPFGFKLFVTVVRSFRTWPATYKWVGCVDLRDLSVSGRWLRK